MTETTGLKILVTGGTRGIGFAIANKFKSSGHKVMVLARGKINGFDESLICDATKPHSVEFSIRAIKEMWVGVDVIINNVGGGGRWGEDKHIDQFDEWEAVFEKNAGAARKFTCAFLPYMQSKNFGRVITIASIHGREAGGLPWFNMAKAAEISLMKSLSKRPENKGITFNTIAPGYINVQGKPYRANAGMPTDVADLTMFLVSAPYINGACIPVDGGESNAF